VPSLYLPSSQFQKDEDVCGNLPVAKVATEKRWLELIVIFIFLALSQHYQAPKENPQVIMTQATAAEDFPVLFLSHGGGPCVFMESEKGGMFSEIDKNSSYADFLRKVGQTLPKPDAIVVVSAHWETPDEIRVLTSPNPSLYFDYYGFPSFTYQLKYGARGHPELARRIIKMIQDAGIPCREENRRGWDHGVFVPLLLVYPEGDIPIVQVSLKRGTDHHFHTALGKALAPLRKEKILIIGSGQATHSFAAFQEPGSPVHPDTRKFGNWLNETLSSPALK
jgi:aromatic ring-opening dioxygenase catalytic subunit (LigB family)